MRCVFPGERCPRPGHHDAAAQQPTAPLHTIQHTGGWASWTLINAIHHAPRHFAVEVWQAVPAPPLDMPQDGGVHHTGYWVDNLPAEANRLDVLGYPATPRPAPRRC
jgi:hypothetical protein